MTRATVSRYLKSEDLLSTITCPYAMVLDVRHRQNGESLAVEELLVRRLANMQIPYQQTPVDFSVPGSTGEADLIVKIKECNADVLILTEQPAEAMSLLYDVMVPAQCTELYAVPSERSKPMGIDMPAYMDWREDRNEQRVARR